MTRYCQMNAEELERFSMRHASAEEVEQFEEHLLICDACRQRFEQVDEFVHAMRSGSARLRSTTEARRPWWKWPRLIPAMAGLALLAVAILAITRFNGQAPPPLAIALTATRGTVAGGTAPAGKTLALRPDLIGIAAPGPYRLEIVDQRGRVTWQGRYSPADGTAVVPGHPAGPHFVRVYSLSGELLREYGLDVQP